MKSFINVAKLANYIAVCILFYFFQKNIAVCIYTEFQIYVIKINGSVPFTNKQLTTLTLAFILSFKFTQLRLKFLYHLLSG